MEKTLKDIIKAKDFKSQDDANAYLIHAGYPIDEVFIINELEKSKKGIAFDKLVIIIKVLNNGWYPNWEDETEIKWVNYFQMKGGFSYWYTDNYLTYATVPSALCLKSEELAKYMIEHYLYLYKDLYE